ncbi:MAG: CRTAC1 family protein [Bryobacteraceae bacterium]
MRPSLCLLLVAGILSAQVRFLDVGREAGLIYPLICGSNEKKTYLIETLGAGVAAIDYDNDGLIDLFTVTASTMDAAPGKTAPTNHLYRNLGNGKFQDVTAEAGLARSGWGQGVCAGDIDNDGFIDLYVTYYGHDVLYHNTGKGRFEDVTAEAGLAGGPPAWGTGCAFVDYDLNGYVDLFASRYVDFDRKTTPTPDQPNACRWKNQPVPCGPKGLRGSTNRLWRNVSKPGSIRFEDVSAPAGILKTGARYSLSVTTLDYDHDGWPDIYVAVDSQASILYRNNHDGTFTDRALEAGVALSDAGAEQAGMGTAAADYDRDGNLDLVKTNFVDDLPNLYRFRSDGGFEETTVPSGLGRHREYMGWGVAFLDFDNDGWPDIFMVNGHIYPHLKTVDYAQRRLLYRNLGNGRFSEASIGDTVQSSRGLATVDFDNDGDIDLLISNLNEPPTLLRNDGGNRQHFLTLKLGGTHANRSAIGARVTVTVANRPMVQEVRSGSTFLSQSDFRLHFGLGEATRADRVEVEWPGGAKENFGPQAADRFVTLTESPRP